MQTIDLEMSKDLSDAFFSPRALSPLRAPSRGMPRNAGRPSKSSSFLDASSVASTTLGLGAR